MNEAIGSPTCVLLVSGKRKCGKDFLTDALIDKIGGGVCTVVKISGPIKQHWASEKGVSFEDLMSSREIKEIHRKAMLDWSEAVRAKDFGYFCRAALQMYNAEAKQIWIVSDTRRKSDIEWFKGNYGDAVLTLRITADDSVRKERGWIFTEGIDDAETECNLDDYSSWDKILCNDGSTEAHVLVDSIINLLGNHNKITMQLLSHVL